MRLAECKRVRETRVTKSLAVLKMDFVSNVQCNSLKLELLLLLGYIICTSRYAGLPFYGISISMEIVEPIDVNRTPLIILRSLKPPKTSNTRNCNYRINFYANLTPVRDTNFIIFST